MPTTDEVVVTMEMVLAGEDAAWRLMPPAQEHYPTDYELSAAVYRAMRALEPAPSGEWTREPVEVDALYLMHTPHGYGVWQRKKGETFGNPTWYRWSTPLPPAPTGDEVK